MRLEGYLIDNKIPLLEMDCKSKNLGNIGKNSDLSYLRNSRF